MPWSCMAVATTEAKARFAHMDGDHLTLLNAARRSSLRYSRVLRPLAVPSLITAVRILGLFQCGSYRGRDILVGTSGLFWDSSLPIITKAGSLELAAVVVYRYSQWVPYRVWAVLG